LHKPELLLVKGIPVTRILQVAEKQKAGMLVMGSKGMTGLRHLLLGSVAEQVPVSPSCRSPSSRNIQRACEEIVSGSNNDRRDMTTC
jgi:hypothetical protein